MVAAQVGWRGLRVGGHAVLSMHSSDKKDELWQWLLSCLQLRKHYRDIIRLHAYTTYIDVACLLFLSSMVCRSVTVVSSEKMAHSIGMPFGLITQVGSRYHVLDGDPDPHGKGQF